MAREHFVAYASVLLVVGLFAVNCRPAFSQTITGDLSGQVTDSTGAVLPKVTVTAVNSGTNFSRSATTSDTGNYRIPDLPIGQYKITATAQGFKTAVQAAEVRAGAIAQASLASSTMSKHIRPAKKAGIVKHVYSMYSDTRSQ